MIHELLANELRLACDPDTIACKSSAEIEAKGTIIGQDRAVRAMRFGLDISDKGFNIFVAGLPGTGRTTAVERFLEEIAITKPAPPDWCYVHNFDDSYRPCAIRLPAGSAREFQKDLDGFLKTVVQEIRTAFESEQYAAQQESSVKSIQEQKEALIEKTNEFARQNSFGLQATPVGILAIPVKDNQPMSEKDFLELSQEDQANLKQTQEKIQDAIETTMRQTRLLDHDANLALEQLDQQVVHFVLDRMLAALMEKNKQLPDVIDHLLPLKKISLRTFPSSSQRKPQKRGRDQLRNEAQRMFTV